MKGASAKTLEFTNMKLVIGDYEVEIKAKAKHHADKSTREQTLMDTMDLLNHISLIMSHGAEQYRNERHKALAEEADKESNDIYIALSDRGYYNV